MTPVVEPLASAPPAPAQVEPTQPQPQAAPIEGEAEESLPPELIEVPAIQAVLAGSPPAVSMQIKGSEDRDEVKLVAKNKDVLLSAGMGFYRSLSGEVGVMFNGLKISPQDIQAADKAGKLLAVAPDFDLVNHEVAKSGADHPALKAGAPVAQGAASASAASPPQSASGQLPLVPPAPASVARKLAAQRVMNLQAGPPTSGSAPGAGRLLNSIMKPVV